ncbi:LytTR family DNA-binding domain-containing protein [Reichenbachiella sp. MALMAid0571]|uniref:LytR/AlgR family response regulator transcription factor n=1 Tax=Reichenbachiella sp. MALMAid0571 TaxID=3143939 RepID=UPI0032DE8E1D
MIILTTAYQDYALEAFEHRVVDYLLKPFALSRFVVACNRAKDEFDLRKQKTNIDNDTPDHFFLHVEYKLVKIEWRKIHYVQGLKDYLKIYLENHTQPIMTRMSMKSIMDKLPARYFFRIHKSYIINISKVSSLNKNFIFIDNIEVPVGESYKDNLSRIIDQGI